MDELAEAAYKASFGKRPITVHLLKRGRKFEHAHFLVSPPYWWFVTSFPKNIAVFFTVDLEVKTAKAEGWAYHHEVQLHSRPFGDGYMIFCNDSFPRAIETFR